MSRRSWATGECEPTDTAATELSTRIAFRLADRAGTPVDELTPLSESIDPESLNSLFASPSADGRVTFVHEGFRITVFGDERIDVTPL